MNNKVDNFYKVVPKKFFKSKFPNPNYKMNMIDTLPFRMLICGPSGSMKTNCLLELIKRTSGSFMHIYLVCKNPNQPLYEFLNSKLEDGLTVLDDVNDLPTCDEMQPEGSKLVIFDDLLMEDNKTTKKISSFFIRGRHFGCSVVYISQSFYQTDILIRRNVNYIIIKRLGSARDAGEILKSYSLQEIDKPTLLKIYKYCLDGDPQNFMMLDLDHPDKMFRKNFLEILNSSDFM